MSSVKVEDHGKTAILRLSNGVTNAISPDLVRDLSKALVAVRNEFDGLILAGGDKFFSIGFDLPTLINFDRSEMSEFFYGFNALCIDLFTLPLPTCCAAKGHATAGGTILALTCDDRVAASGKKFVGLNEIKLGVPVPYLTDLILRQIVTDRAANEILYGGEFLTTSSAKEIGLIGEVFPLEEVENEALGRVSRLADLPGAAFSAIKANRVETVRLRYEANYKSRNETFLDCWFSKPVRVLLEEASLKF